MKIDVHRTAGRQGPARLFLVAFLTLVLLATAAVLGFLSPAGRKAMLGARLRWVTTVRKDRPAELERLFREELIRSLHQAGIDTSLVRLEPVSPSGEQVSRTRYEIPLPEGFATSRGNAVVTSVVERLGGKVTDGVEEAPNRVLVTASLSRAVTDQILLMGKDAPRGATRLALLVDYFGSPNSAESQTLMEIGRGLSVAILPHTTGARDFADRCRTRGIEVLVNLPMEGLDYPRLDPGPGAILVDMAPGDIAKSVERAFDQIGGASGVHTYLGELAVEDRDVMRAVLQKVAERHAYFVESTASSFSVVRETAAQVGAASLKLRDEIDAPGVKEARVRRNLAALAEEAQERGVAVGLIHPYPATVAALKSLLPEWQRNGIELVPLSEIVTVPRE
jgi:polysaccharide deacetylase 2 family uncharacterized protein YibQ